jgi:hypothetical protein
MRNHNLAKVGAGLMLILSTCGIYGCVAYQFRSEFPPLAENEPHKAMFQDLALGIERPSGKAQMYDLEKFLNDLRQSQIFRAVDYVEKISTTDLVLTSFASKGTNPYHACLLGFEGQLLTYATFGLLPQICKADHEVSFDLYSPKNQQQKKTISFRYQTRSVLGWAALFYLPSSDWSAKPLKDEFATLLRSGFDRQANDIQQLLK